MADTHTPAASLLGQMLAGIGMATGGAPLDVPTLSLEDAEPQGDFGMAATLVLPSGDKYRVTVEWLRDESP